MCDSPVINHSRTCHCGTGCAVCLFVTSVETEVEVTHWKTPGFNSMTKELNPGCFGVFQCVTSPFFSVCDFFCPLFIYIIKIHNIVHSCFITVTSKLDACMLVPYSDCSPPWWD